MRRGIEAYTSMIASACAFVALIKCYTHRLAFSATAVVGGANAQWHYTNSGGGCAATAEIEHYTRRR